MINPVLAAFNIIRPGETVFIGEQGLDITLAMEGDTQIGWWASGASIMDSSPTSGSVSVSNPTSFSISRGTNTGVWYHINPSDKANGTAFNVADPQLSIIVEDTTVNVDVTDKWVPTDDELRFRIDSNLVPISQRTGVTAVPISFPITIKVQSPDGAVYTSLISKSGTKSIVDYPVTTTPQYTDSIWGTSYRDTYPPGTYTIWAECNVNSMKDYYDVAGKTISRKVSLLNQDQNPLIANKGYVTNPSTQITLVPTTKIITIATTTAPTTLKTPPPTTAVPTVLPETTVETVMPTTSLPTPTPTKSPGFEASIVVVAMIIGVVFLFKKQ
ncbi:MAG: DUF3821 domain-containing protein [Methanoregula sp.]|nr:DUF3821 domain-containing protein [Methanoregula sp.]